MGGFSAVNMRGWWIDESDGRTLEIVTRVLMEWRSLSFS